MEFFKQIGYWAKLISACIVTGVLCVTITNLMNNTGYLKYIDAETIDIAKDMQAICKTRKVCDKKEIIYRMMRIQGESLLEAPTPGK